MSMWLAARGLSLVAVARAAGLSHVSLYNLLDEPGRARHGTLAAIASAMSAASGQAITADQVAALAHRKVRDPDHVSDEIAQALAGAKKD